MPLTHVAHNMHFGTRSSEPIKLASVVQQSVSPTMKQFRVTGLFLLVVILAGAYSAPLSNEDVIKQLLQIREDLLAVKLLQATQQEILPLLSHPPAHYSNADKFHQNILLIQEVA